jgi:cytochrome c-type biogenesis protein CcmE
MNDRIKRRLLACLYALAMVAMAGSLTFAALRPKAHAASCSEAGIPCNLTDGHYICTGGLNDAPPIPGCACDLTNFCVSD